MSAIYRGLGITLKAVTKIGPMFSVECHGDHCYNGGVCAVEDDALTCYCHDTGYEGDRCQTSMTPLLVKSKITRL